MWEPGLQKTKTILNTNSLIFFLPGKIKNILSCVYCSFVHNKGGGGGIRFYEYLRLRKLYKM